MPVCETVRCWGNLHCSLAQAYEMPRDGVIWLLVYFKAGLANSEFCDQFISLASSGELFVQCRAWQVQDYLFHWHQGVKLSSMIDQDYLYLFFFLYLVSFILLSILGPKKLRTVRQQQPNLAHRSQMTVRGELRVGRASINWRILVIIPCQSLLILPLNDKGHRQTEC